MTFSFREDFILCYHFKSLIGSLYGRFICQELLVAHGFEFGKVMCAEEGSLVSESLEYMWTVQRKPQSHLETEALSKTLNRVYDLFIVHIL